MAHNFSEVDVDQSELLQPGYRAKELVDKSITIEEVTVANGQNGEFLICKISGEGLEPGRNFVTGAQNIVARIMKAVGLGLLPITGTIKAHGSSFDIE